MTIDFSPLETLISARDRLLELRDESQGADPVPWRLQRFDARGFTAIRNQAEFRVGLNHGEFFTGSAELIVVLRNAGLDYLIERLTIAVAGAEHQGIVHPSDVELAQGILEAGQ